MLVNLKDVLIPAQKGGYAVGLFNTTDTDMLEGVLAAAEELRAPVIIGTAEVLLPFGELKLIAPSVRAAAERATVPVVLHYDHGLTVERCIEALDLGFTSIMFDGSAGDADANIELTRKVVEMCHARGVTVEGEIGHVGNADVEGDQDNNYTTPEEAKAFVEATGVDALAVAIGTAHGAYKHKPCLDLNRLAEIRSTIDTPLVLHGGSGLTDDDFRNTIKNGIAKVNIFTDLCLAGERACKRGLEENAGYLNMRNMKVEEIKKETMKKMLVFGCNGRA
ncbi:MAG: class II fructose-bisphosphate aldolase [Clostridia bacterium]|jgi:fructose-bisphosphate aldolase class II|nr:class II fructose-bisphosphate aldolase [Clostridia bacterium]